MIVEAENYTEQSSYTTPTTYHTNIHATAHGNNAYGSATTTSTGGQTYNISKPSTSNTIYLLVERPEGGTITYNAKFVRESIREKYGILDK